MTNEDKILALLEKITEKISSLESNVTAIQTEQASDRQLLELTASQVSKLTVDMDKIKGEIGSIKEEISSIRNTVIRIENDHGRKLNALFDGYKQNAEKLTRIEEEVSKH
ncbi:MAG TPA: hypothetical protein GXZ32_07215 [Clostridiales bacterium]|nr:hypothetical protein [Clostridiales bacterium]